MLEFMQPTKGTFITASSVLPMLATPPSSREGVPTGHVTNPLRPIMATYGYRTCLDVELLLNTV